MTDTAVVSLSFFRFSKPSSRIWAFAMMGLARRAMSRVPDIGFWKLCGSGTGEGFTPIPNTSVYAILACWPDQDTADQQLATADVFQRYQTRASECWTVFLRTTSVRGAWSGQTPFRGGTSTPGRPIAALTRATIKPTAALKFWRRVPDISRMVGSDQNVAFKIGIGEVPLLHQITFSIWPNQEAMAGFARTNGPHAAAIRAVREGNWFSEELYARFDILGQRGSWDGANPLSSLETAA